MRSSSIKSGSMPPPPTFKGSETSSDDKNVSRTISSYSNNSASCKFQQFVGPSCGHHASYTFYKACKYTSKNGETKILSLGEFFFVKIWHDSDIISIGELQLLWEDKTSNQILTSVRLYFLPEYTPDGRLHYHGEDEVIAVAEKSVLRVTDLLDWITSPKDVQWDRGTLGICELDCSPVSTTVPNFDLGLNSKFAPGYSEFLSDVRKEKTAIGDNLDPDDVTVVILSIPQYSRYRAMASRIKGREKQWMHNSLISALGGFTAPTRNTRVLFCRDFFDYAELEEHPFLCNHLAPKLKGRPRKRKKLARPGSPGSESGSSESSVATSISTSVSAKNSPRNGLRKDLLAILSQKNTKEETDFLKRLVNFMEKRNTPIERPPMLGYKQIDLHLFFEKVNQHGGYDGCTQKKTWKVIYDDLGGNPANTSAATCTRKHYERFLLPFERYLRGHGDKKALRKEMDLCEISEADDNDVKEKISGKEEADRGSDDSVKSCDENSRKGTNGKSPHELTSSEMLKNNPLLAQGLQSLVGSKAEPNMKIDPDGKRLQIDDLIIIPNHLHSPPEGGSALKSLAQIASRYQGAANAVGLPPEGNGPKRPKLEEERPGSNLGAKASGDIPASQQQNLFSVFPPGWLPGTWPQASSNSGAKTSTPTPSGGKGAPPSSTAAMNSALALAAAAAAAGFSEFPITDPSKFGTEAYAQLLELYQKQLFQKNVKTSTPPSTSSTSTGTSNSKKDSTKDKERQKVSKPPPDTKRPPNLLQTPCAFSPTNHFYTNPMVELTKAKEAVAAATASVGSNTKLPMGAGTIDSQLSRAAPVNILDLSSCRKPSPKVEPPQGLLNLKKESSLLANPNAMSSSINLMSPGLKRENFSHPLGFSSSIPLQGSSPSLKIETKSSLFSAESLLNKTSSTPNKSFQSNSDLVKLSAEKGKQEPLSRLSPAMPLTSTSLPRASPASGPSPFSTSQSPLPSQDKSRSSPWHVGSLQKPAVPVPPVVRDTDPSKKDTGLADFQSALFGLSVPPSTTATPTTSCALPPSSFSLSPSGNSISAAQQLATNPYLALMSMGSLPPVSSSAAASTMPKGLQATFPPHLMDPATSAYYAALYSQQMYGLSPYLGSAGLRPGMQTPGSGASSNQITAAAMAAVAAGLDPLQASALQGMLSRGASSTPSNPFGASSLSGTLPGFLGYPTFPPQTGRKDT